MDSKSPSAIPNSPCNPRDLMWSRLEKAIARRAFEAALQRELDQVIQEVKQMAAQIKDASGLWGLERYLTQRRHEIDRKYDYRYSELTLVFGRLLRENRVSEEELRGLREDKLALIRAYAKFIVRMEAA